MNQPWHIPLVTTIKERCRVCYTCVRECPAKAIRIANGQADVIPERCIGCGNCVRVCSQHAKLVLDGTAQVRRLLEGADPVAAMLAPSFPAEFIECQPRQVAGLLKALGFAIVGDVAFGADLVGEAYRKLLGQASSKRYIATTCPAVVGYVERYCPSLVDSLAPIVSPMIAMARVLRHLHGPNLKTVFIGPCIAKKGEAASQPVAGAVDASLTFVELREMLAARGLTPQSVTEADFDPPHAGLGALFPISRGLLQAANIQEDLLTGAVVAADGRSNFVLALEEFGTGALDARLVEALCCHGCIMGAGMSTDASQFYRRAHVARHARQQAQRLDQQRWRADMAALAELDLHRQFISDDQSVNLPFEDELGQIMAKMGKFRQEDELNCGACGYDTCREHAAAIFKGLAESEMCLPYTIDQLRKTVEELAVSNGQLASAREALLQSEKLASMGQLAAGIAHEVNNPLGVVLMYAHLLLEHGSDDQRLCEDMGVIVEQANRCKKIVSGLLRFARQNKVSLNPTELGELVESALRTVRVPPGVQVRTRIDPLYPRADLDGDQMVQVLTNLLTNALAAMPGGGELSISAGGDAAQVRLAVADTGTGIPPEHQAKIFEPFFTTKPLGEGTGLGLAVAYGIVKMHHGDITVTSNTDAAAGPTGTTFTVTLPRLASRWERSV